VDSGLDETDSQPSLVGESSRLSDDRRSCSLRLAPISSRGRRGAFISSSVVDPRIDGERQSMGKIWNHDPEDRASLSPRRNGTGQSDTHSYFKSPLELEMEKKLEEERVSETVLRRVKEAKLKELAIAQAKVEAEMQTTRDIWKRLYFESKMKTLPLDDQVQELKEELERCRDEILRKMKTKVVQRSKRLTAEASMRKRNLLQRRESRVTKQSRGLKAAAVATPLFFKEDGFSRKMEEKKQAKLEEETEGLRKKVDATTVKIKEMTREKAQEKERLDLLRRQLKSLKVDLAGKR